MVPAMDNKQAAYTLSWFCSGGDPHVCAKLLVVLTIAEGIKPGTVDTIKAAIQQARAKEI